VAAHRDGGDDIIGAGEHVAAVGAGLDGEVSALLGDHLAGQARGQVELFSVDIDEGDGAAGPSAGRG